MALQFRNGDVVALVRLGSAEGEIKNSAEYDKNGDADAKRSFVHAGTARVGGGGASVKLRRLPAIEAEGELGEVEQGLRPTAIYRRGGMRRWS